MHPLLSPSPLPAFHPHPLSLPFHQTGHTILATPVPPLSPGSAATPRHPSIPTKPSTITTLHYTDLSFHICHTTPQFSTSFLFLSPSSWHASPHSYCSSRLMRFSLFPLPLLSSSFPAATCHSCYSYCHGMLCFLLIDSFLCIQIPNLPSLPFLSHSSSILAIIPSLNTQSRQCLPLHTHPSQLSLLPASASPLP